MSRNNIKKVDWTKTAGANTVCSKFRQRRASSQLPKANTLNMSTSRRPYFVISALPADDMAQQEMEIEQVFHMEAEEAREKIEKMTNTLTENGFDFDCVYSRDIWTFRCGIGRLIMTPSSDFGISKTWLQRNPRQT